jgi:predicted ATP-dependent serine protease
MENYIRMSDVQARSVPRLRTGFDELDFIYGCSDDASGLPSIWGVPAGMISLWKGRSGVGKSRLAIDIAKKVSSAAIKVLYFQNEESLAEFTGWAKGCDCNDLYCSVQNKLDQMIKVIHEVQPSLVFIDSVNKVEDFFYADGSETDRLIDSLRHALIDVGALNGGCHLILLGQADSNGSMKIGTSLPHAVDTVLDVRPWNNGEVGSVFTIRIGEKHRYGRRGKEFWSCWIHYDYGIKSGSSNRWSDEKWCKGHGHRTYSRIEVIHDVHKGGSLPDPAARSNDCEEEQGFLNWLLFGSRD